jgi:hypothetical protein
VKVEPIHPYAKKPVGQQNPYSKIYNRRILGHSLEKSWSALQKRDDKLILFLSKNSKTLLTPKTEIINNFLTTKQIDSIRLAQVIRFIIFSNNDIFLNFRKLFILRGSR